MNFSLQCITTTSSSSKPLDFDPEIDRAYHRRLKQSVEDTAYNLSLEEHLCSDTESGSDTKEPIMAEGRKTNLDYTRTTLDGTTPIVVKPPIQANNFEIKGVVINMFQQYCQFDCLPDENPHAHIQTFLEIC